MDDYTARGDLDDIEQLLPPHTTEYRSGSVLVTLRNPYEEPVTVPDLPAIQAD
jgi:hypothetical protein